MRIAIYGTGGVGGYFSGRLAQAGHDVTFIARGAHLEALRRDGLRVASVRGDFHIRPAKATDKTSDVGEVDLVLLAVKTWQLGECSRALEPMLGPHTAVMTLQNGVEAPDIVAEIIGRERVLPGVARVLSEVSAPGHILHIGGPGLITFGEMSGGATERTERVRETLAGAGIAVEVPADMRTALWTKFLFVVPLGGLGAVTRAPLGSLLAVPETRRLVEGAMEEILQVARGHGVRMPDDVVATSMAFADKQPPAGNSSLHRDIASGRPSELEAWSGAVARLGAKVGVPTPINSFCYHSLLPLERRARGELAFTIL